MNDTIRTLETRLANGLTWLAEREARGDIGDEYQFQLTRWEELNRKHDEEMLRAIARTDPDYARAILAFKALHTPRHREEPIAA